MKTSSRNLLFFIFGVFLTLFINLKTAKADTGILPTSPFYFFKEWRRNLQTFLTADNYLRRAEVELLHLSEMAAEMKKLDDIAPQKLGTLKKILEKYEKSSNNLANQLPALQTEETDNLNRFSDEITGKLTNQQTIFEELKFKQPKIKDHIEKLQSRIDGILTVSLNLDEKNLMKRWLQLFGEENTLQEIKTIGVLNRLPFESNPKIAYLKEELSIRLEARLLAEEFTKENLLEALKSYPVSNLHKVEALENIREHVLDYEIKTGLNLIRQQLLEEAGNNDAQPESQKIIEKAESAINLQKTRREGSAEKFLLQNIIDRAEISLEQAKRFYFNKDYLNAFGQGVTALTAARDGIARKEKNITELRVKYDALFGRRSPAATPFLLPLFSETEKLIVKISSKPEEENIKKIKSLLYTIEALIRKEENNK